MLKIYFDSRKVGIIMNQTKIILGKKECDHLYSETYANHKQIIIMNITKVDGKIWRWVNFKIRTILCPWQPLSLMQLNPV